MKLSIKKKAKITSWLIEGEKVEAVTDFIFLVSKITAGSDCSHKIKRHLILGKKVIANLDSTLKSRDFANKGPYGQSYDFSSSHVQMWEFAHKEGWMLKNWCFQTVVLEKIFESLLDSRRSKQSHLWLTHVNVWQKPPKYCKIISLQLK